MRLFLNKHLNIAVYAIAASCISLTRNVDNHALSNPGRNLDLNNLFTFDDTLAATVLTLVLNDLTFAAASRTDALGLHHAENALRRMADDA